MYFGLYTDANVISRLSIHQVPPVGLNTFVIGLRKIT
jgi:hypothetical protein